MVSSDTARLGILKRAKNPTPPPMIRYRDVRPVIRAFLADRARDVNPLLEVEKMFEQRAEDSAYSALMQNDASNSVDVLHSLQGMSNQLVPFDFLSAPKKQAKLMVAGVQVSVYADLMVEAVIKGDKNIGAAILKMSQDNTETDAAKSKRRDIGLYVATLIRMHIDKNLKDDLPVANKLCMSIDIQHGEAFQAPTSNTKRQKDIESACQMIAGYWPSV